MGTRQWLSALLLLAVALMLFISYLSYRKRHLPVARTMALVMLAASFYSFGYAFELLSGSLAEVKGWLQVEYAGIPFVSTLWLVLVVQFTGAAAGRRRLLTTLVFIVPALTFLIHLTNDWHHLLYRQYIPNAGSDIPLFNTAKGPWYWVHVIYNYAVLLLGIALFVPMYLRSLPIVRKQIFILILGAAVPMLCNVVYLFGMNVDLTPFGFALSGIVYIWGIYRFNLLRLTPLALAKVFDTIRDGVVLLDYENRIVSFNRAAEEVFPELGPHRRTPADAGDMLAAYPELQERLLASGGKDERFPFRQKRLRKHYTCSLSFVYETDKMPLGKMLMFNDITELVENESRLRENARQLSELNAFKDKLFTIMAHDIRDPVALMVSLTELLEVELAAADIAHLDVFQEVKGQVRGTFQLIENLLDWYRSQKGKVVFEPLGWNLKQVVRQALSPAKARALMKRIDLTENINETLTVYADKEMLNLILRNLLSNAIKYTGIGGAIEVGAAEEGGLIVVSVRDNGAGIDREMFELLRQEEPLIRQVGGGEEAGGTKFGLVLAREFVRINGGSLWFDSVPGKGSTFSFSLPVAAEEGDGAGGVETGESVYESDIAGR